MTVRPPSTDDRWVEVQIETAPEAAEIAADAAGAWSQGVELRDQDTLLKAPPGRALVVALVRPDEVSGLLHDVETALATARAAGVAVDPVMLRRRDADEVEWRDVWKQFFRAQRIGHRFIVRPSWDADGAVVEPGDHVIEIDPGRAFGTGAHASTRLVIALAEGLAERGLAVGRFLDLGCGSGILSIAAARLWPDAPGEALDVDAESAACATENLERNRITSVDARVGTLDDARGPFDLVMANIQAEVLTELAPALAAHLRPGGAVLLSGLLTEQTDAVAACYQTAGFRITRRLDEGEWSALAVEV